MNSHQLYQAGSLTDAIQAALDEVKKAPTDASRRGFLCELLCFAGELERADKQLETIGQQDAKAMVGVAMFRQLVRAEQARQQFYADGRVPEFLAEASPNVRLRLQASIELREGRAAEADKLLAQAEAERPRVRGNSQEQPFDDFRDLDDLASGVFEVLTSNGKYYWVPTDAVELLEFHPPKRPQDLLWRRVHMVVRGGPDGEVFIPVLYPGTARSTDDHLRLGRATDWIAGDDQPVRGLGQRTYLVGEADVPIMDLKEVTFQEA